MVILNWFHRSMFKNTTCARIKILFTLLVQAQLFFLISMFQPFYFPDHAGFPLSTPTDGSSLYFRIEMHYDNPDHVEGKTFPLNFHVIHMEALALHTLVTLWVS